MAIWRTGDSAHAGRQSESGVGYVAPPRCGVLLFLVRWGLDLLLSASQTWTHINGDGSALRTWHASHNEADMPNLFAGRLNLLQPSAALSFVASNDGDRAATG